MRKFTLSLVFSAVLGFGAASVHANTIYFYDDFEGDLSKWVPGSSFIANHASQGNVMTFATQTSGGDAYTLFELPVPLPGETLYLSFDYAGEGGFIGLGPGSNYWLAGLAGYLTASPTYTALSYGSGWTHYEIALPAAAVGKIMTEDWDGYSPAVPGAYFDNIIVANYRGATIPTPDGGTTLSLLGLAILGLAGLRRCRG